MRDIEISTSHVLNLVLKEFFFIFKTNLTTGKIASVALGSISMLLLLMSNKIVFSSIRFRTAIFVAIVSFSILIMDDFMSFETT